MQTNTPARGGPQEGAGEIHAIQMLRGVAAFGVLLYHAADRAGWAFGVGAAGVDVFFVISGFIMWVVTSRRPVTPGRFLVHRIRRIVPLYWAVTLSMAAVAVAVPAAFPALNPTLGKVAASLAFIPYRDDTGLIAPLLVPGWTLNYEMLFYLVFAAGLLAPARWRLVGVTAVLVALTAMRPLVDLSNPLAATYTDPLLLEFAAGLWLGWAWSNRRLPGGLGSGLLAAAGLAGFLVAHLTGVDVSVARPLIWGLPALALVAGAVGLEQAGRIGTWTPLRLLGDSSYSLYLIHGLAISVAVRLMAAVGMDHRVVVFLVAVPAGIAAGFALYNLAEKPLVRLLSGRSRAAARQ